MTICKKCGSGQTILGACISCREKEGYSAFYEGKKLPENPYTDADSYSWESGWHDGLLEKYSCPENFDLDIPD